jgi:hypothetical protein
MATTTPNYGWTVPTSTDLVKDGATAIETLGDAVDATVFANAGAAINKTIVDAKGDLIAATASDTVARLAVGANDTVLTADSTAATGMKWASAGGASTNYSLLSTNTTTGVNSITFSGLSGKSKYMIYYQLQNSSNVIAPALRFNGDTGGNYTVTTQVQRDNAAIFNTSATGQSQINTFIGNLVNVNNTLSGGMILIDGTNSSSFYTVTWLSVEGGAKAITYGIYNASATCSSITLLSDAGYNWTSNTTKLFGSVS